MDVTALHSSTKRLSDHVCHVEHTSWRRPPTTSTRKLGVVTHVRLLHSHPQNGLVSESILPVLICSFACNNARRSLALPHAAAPSCDSSLQQVIAIDVEFIHYTPNGGEAQSAAAYVCLVDREMNVLFKSFINPGLPSEARLKGGVRLADIKDAPTLSTVGALAP